MLGKKLFGYLFVVILLASCNSTGNKQGDESQEAQKEVVSASGVDQDQFKEGTFAGTLPCADCEGIETTLTLNKDGKYTLEQNYLGEEDGEFKDEGTWTLDEENGVISLSDIEDASNLYKVSGENLVQLNKDGSEVEGELADMYVLTRK